MRRRGPIPFGEARNKVLATLRRCLVRGPAGGNDPGGKRRCSAVGDKIELSGFVAHELSALVVRVGGLTVPRLVRADRSPTGADSRSGLSLPMGSIGVARSRQPQPRRRACPRFHGGRPRASGVRRGAHLRHQGAVGLVLGQLARPVEHRHAPIGVGVDPISWTLILRATRSDCQLGYVIELLRKKWTPRLPSRPPSRIRNHNESEFIQTSACRDAPLSIHFPAASQAGDLSVTP